MATQPVLPVQMPGHWDTAEGAEMASRSLEFSRAQLCKGNLSDLALANAQYLETIDIGTVQFQSAIAMQTAAKERIRWLSAHLALAVAALEELHLKAVIGTNDELHAALDNAWAAISKARSQ